MNQAVQQTDTKALAVAEFVEFETKLQEFKEKYIDVVYDLDDEDQGKQARSDKKEIGVVISALDSTHKRKKAPLKAEVDLLDGERKRIKDDLLGVQLKIKSQIEEHERKIQEHAEMLQDKVDAIRYHAEVGDMHIPTNQLSAADLKERLVMIKSLDVDDSYEHRKADATLAQIDTIKTLEGLLTDRLKHEEEQAELERLRTEAAARAQAEREEQIRKEAVAAEAQRAADETQRKEKEAKAEKEAQRIKYYESMIKHINQCAHGFIGGEMQSSYGILLYELEEKIIIDDSWGEFKEPALLARTEAVSTLKKLQDESRKKAEEEEKQATEQAKAEAGRAAQETADAAERDRVKAAQAAQRDIDEAKAKQREAEKAAERAAEEERGRIEAEQRKAAEETEKHNQAETARKAKQEYRAEIHGQAKQSLIDNGIPEDMAGQIVTLIKDGLIKNIQVNY